MIENPHEMMKFSEMAPHWWDLNGPCKPLHDINPIRLQFIEKHCHLLHKNVLDIACGGGILSEAMAKAGAKVTGIDANKDVITIARLHRHETNCDIEYHCITSTEFAVEHSQQFDVITCMELLEHVDSPKVIIEDCKKMLKPNGLLFLSTINRNLKAYLYTILGAEYLLKLLPKGTHDYDKFLKPSEIAKIARNNSLKLVDMQGMNYNPITNAYSLSNDVSVNYLICYQSL